MYNNVRTIGSVRAVLKGVHMKKQWYLETWFIALVFAFSSLVVPFIAGCILVYFQHKKTQKINIRLTTIATSHNELQAKHNQLSKTHNDLGITSVVEAQNVLKEIQLETERIQYQLNISRMDYEQSTEELTKVTKKLASAKRALKKSKEIHKSINYAIKKYFNHDVQHFDVVIPASDLMEAERLAPGVSMHLHSMDIKELRKAFNENNRLIEQTLKEYDSRYTTKANKSIYSLMVISLKAELQNVLINLKYGKLDDSIQLIKTITEKYQVIAAEGNQNIAGTISKFIGEIEYLFINAVKIEYNYYVKKQQAKEEQAAIRQQMKEEAAERRELKKQKDRIEQEETKFTNELSSLKSQIETADDVAAQLLKSRILELEAQLSDVLIKKEEISNLQNGKAGNVYIISNLGSFGDNIFKVGMTRRINPEERVNELGSASVPFKFDIHSFIFSNDAVGLESKLHEKLHGKRVNKANYRKEFFKVSIDELEELVLEEDPTAEFVKTMAAEEYYQSLSTTDEDEVDYVNSDNDDDDDYDDTIDFDEYEVDGDVEDTVYA